MSERQTRAGFVAVIGAPNAGKSTLVNALVGQKVAIVSPKAQTTRSRLMGASLRANAPQQPAPSATEEKTAETPAAEATAKTEPPTRNP